MSEYVFPVPSSGEVEIVERDLDTFDVQCSGLNETDVEQLTGFFIKMGGRFRDFRFEYQGVSKPKCRFTVDTMPPLDRESMSLRLPLTTLR